MSAPVSAVMTCAVVVPMPGIEEISSQNPRKGSITTSIRLVSSSMAVVCWSISPRCIRTKNA